MNNLLLRAVAIILLLNGLVGVAQAQAPVPANGIRVLVYGIHYGGNLIYSYKVINNGDTKFNNFTIGSEFDSVENEAFPQLTRLPLGWKYGETGEVGTEIILAPGSTKQPQNWKARVFGKQEASNYYLRWSAPRGHGSASNAILPGQTLAGFSVTIPPVDSKLSLPMVTGQPVLTGPDEKYLKGNFAVGLASGINVWGTLEREDITVPPNRKLVPITAAITVKDDYDPAPEIQLVSITANEPLDKSDAKDVQPGTDDRQFQLKAERKEDNKAGRIYTVTYSATDGSGNKTTASATVTVLHDERGHDERGHDDRRDDKDKKDKDDHKRER
jgi:hypothetical protein